MQLREKHYVKSQKRQNNAIELTKVHPNCAAKRSRRTYRLINDRLSYMRRRRRACCNAPLHVGERCLSRRDRRISEGVNSLLLTRGRTRRSLSFSLPNDGGNCLPVALVPLGIDNTTRIERYPVSPGNSERSSARLASSWRPYTLVPFTQWP